VVTLLLGTTFAVLPLKREVVVRPNLDPDVKMIGLAIHESLSVVQKQIRLLTQRLLRSQVRLDELQTELQKTKEKL
jgi:hypothetical protein